MVSLEDYYISPYAVSRLRELHAYPLAGSWRGSAKPWIKCARKALSSGSCLRTNTHRNWCNTKRSFRTPSRSSRQVLIGVLLPLRDLDCSYADADTLATSQMIQSVRVEYGMTRVENKQDEVLDILRASTLIGPARPADTGGIQFKALSSSGLYIQASFGRGSFFF